MAVSPDSANWDKNLFAYCDNNPVSRKDASGQLWVQLLGGAVYGLATQFAGDLIYSLTTGTSFSDFTTLGDYGAAMVSGMVGAVAGPVLSTAVDVLVAPAIKQLVNNEISGESFDLGVYAEDARYNLVSAGIASGVYAKVPESVKDVYADAYIYGARQGSEINAFYRIQKAATKAWNGIVDTVSSWFGNWRKN